MPVLPDDFPHEAFNYGDGKNITSAFQVPICHYSNTEILKSLKDYIISDDPKGIESAVTPDIKHNLSESKFDLLKRDVEIIKITKNWFETCIKNAFNYLEHAPNDYKFDFKDSWYHITKNGGMHEGHSHQNCSWCGIYYIDVGNDSDGGYTVFDNPIRSTYSDYGSQMFNANSCFRIKPENGHLVLFPSYLYHYQSLYNGSKDRIVIGFNVTVDYHSTQLGIVSKESGHSVEQNELPPPCQGQGCADNQPVTSLGNAFGSQVAWTDIKESTKGK